MDRKYLVLPAMLALWPDPSKENLSSCIPTARPRRSLSRTMSRAANQWFLAQI